MDQWLASIPKKILAVGAISLGIIFIVLSDPPHTVCDGQISHFKSSQEGSLYLKKGLTTVADQNTGEARRTEFDNSRYQCLRSNAPGGCLEYFLKLRGLERQMGEVEQDCRGKLASIPVVQKSIWETLDLFVKMAWGSQPPAGVFARNGWFGAVEMNLYCTYKSIAQEFYGRQEWRQRREAWITTLPGVKKLNRTQVWDRILLSANCRNY